MSKFDEQSGVAAVEYTRREFLFDVARVVADEPDHPARSLCKRVAAGLDAEIDKSDATWHSSEDC